MSATLKAALCLVLIVGLPHAAFAQSAIAGNVTDSFGAPIAGVTVAASSPELIEKIRTTETDSAGRYRIENLRPGTYVVTFTLEGWSPLKREGIELTGSFTATIDVQLAIGRLTDLITVAGATPIVDVHSAKREVTLSGEVVRSIPTVRSYVNQVDWRQLRQWGIDEGRVPAGTIVRFRDPTTWDRYRAYILGALAVLLMQTALIAGLLIQRARRQRAENELRKSQAALQSSYERIRDLGGRLLKAQETERSRIARELHDDISQQASLLAIDLALIRRRQDQTNTLTDEALNKAEGIVKSVHDLSHRLHPAKLRLIGLVPALRDLQRELSHADVPITFTDDNVPAILPHDVTLCLFRIVQEGLQNAIKYSQAHRISVRLAGGPRELTLTIEDDGVGFDIDSAWGQGLGLISMGERVEVFGGNFHVRSAPGAGTRIEATVPLHVVEDRDFVAV